MTYFIKICHFFAKFTNLFEISLYPWYNIKDKTPCVNR